MSAPEEKLRAALADAAESVNESPDAYRRAQRYWHRREWQRRAVMITIVLFLVAIACVAGVWALSGASPGKHVIFNDQARHSSSPSPPGTP
ncbi:hypothetical protein [Streptomyces decoyicus]|uniref:hypothetical protein n=1 Tax=Streptomyces decoyicus TaxID=249567 RepID=UPI003868D65C